MVEQNGGTGEQPWWNSEVEKWNSEVEKWNSNCGTV